jgi:hypothetical protein
VGNSSYVEGRKSFPITKLTGTLKNIFPITSFREKRDQKTRFTELVLVNVKKLFFGRRAQAEREKYFYLVYYVSTYFVFHIPDVCPTKPFFCAHKKA